MPAQRPRAAFEPFSPNLNISALVNSTPNFEEVVRIHCDAIDENGLENFEKLVLLHVVVRGLPLVVEGFDKILDSSVFSEKWLRNHYSAKQEQARDLTAKKNVPLTIGHYLKNMPLLTDQWNEYNYKDTSLQRLYLKDIDCPKIWHDCLKKIIPPFLFYLNKSADLESFEGPGARTARSSKARNAAGKQVAKAGDLMSCLPSDMRAENLMCYIGHEGTYTPAHQEMCASLGQNLMVDASDGSVENGNATQPGSSVWFMTSSKDRKLVSEYWNSVLGHDINIEDHFAQINAWKAAPFTTYIVEQRPGDFILVPPLAAHQVWNRGTRTMKVAWNRTTVETLERALNEALPPSRMVCRDEQYKNKAIVFYSLKHYSALLDGVDEANLRHPRVQQLQNEFEQLFALYNQIILSESFSQTLPKEKTVEYIPFDSNITCSYCRGNIFNRFLTCPSCATTPDDAYDICMECYAMGRSCACVSKLKWAEQFRWSELIEKHEIWRQQLLTANPSLGERFRPFREERAEMGRKSLAQICQEELKRRPWVDITKPKPVVEVVDDLSEPEAPSPPAKRRKTGRSEKSTPKSKAPRCHICKYAEPTWKLASCSNPKCSLKYCYGSLFRAFNMLPQEILETIGWECPRCRKICSCGACRKNPRMTPFEPTSTSLGHDTSKIADPRSVESLVDFRHSNLGWLKKAGSDEIGRLRKHQEEADAKRNQALEDNSIQVEFYPDMSQGLDYSQLELEKVAQAAFHANYADIPVDPALESSILAPVNSWG
ncbi:putative JmjC domain protein [Aspergillus lucknowensis]|uniref:JmjC domain-containing protein n=1 Tax=Aspergillus lucknowensis TaxID=176173 RepID=A0ABR4LES5_9EURO